MKVGEDNSMSNEEYLKKILENGPYNSLSLEECRIILKHYQKNIKQDDTISYSEILNSLSDKVSKEVFFKEINELIKRFFVNHPVDIEELTSTFEDERLNEILQMIDDSDKEKIFSVLTNSIILENKFKGILYRFLEKDDNFLKLIEMNPYFIDNINIRSHYFQEMLKSRLNNINYENISELLINNRLYN